MQPGSEPILLNKACPAWMPDRSPHGWVHGVFVCNIGCKQPGVSVNAIPFEAGGGNYYLTEAIAPILNLL